MHLSRVAPLALVLALQAAACEEVPDYSGSKLVGRWRNDVTGPGSDGQTSRTITETMFRANGYNLHNDKWIRYALISEDEKRVVIEYTREVPYDMSRQRTFEFLSADRIREVGNGNVEYDRFDGPQ